MPPSAFSAIPPVLNRSDSSVESGYADVLRLLPTLRPEIERILADTAADRERSVPLSEFPDNSGIAPRETVENEKVRLLNLLFRLSRRLGWKPPIVLIQDGCFTNRLLKDTLSRILTEGGYSLFVSELAIDFDAPMDDRSLQSSVPEDRLVIIGGSFSDTDTIPSAMYSNHLSRIVRLNASGTWSEVPNNRFLGICFGQQYLANLVGMEYIDSPNVIATIRGSAQFCPSPCHLADLRFENPIIRHAFSGLSNAWENHDFSAAFTRTGHVHFDLLGSKRPLSVVPAATDRMTGDVVGWGTKNGRILGVQFHPEIRFSANGDDVIEAVSPFIPVLERRYGEGIHGIRESYDPGTLAAHFGHDIDEAFYVFALSALVEDLLKTAKMGRSAVFSGEGTADFSIPKYSDSVESVIRSIRSRVSEMASRTQVSFHPPKSQQERVSLLSEIDRAGKLELTRWLDWKVNRSEEEYADVLGIRSVADLVLRQREFLRRYGLTQPFVFCDFGAGNGTFLQDSYKKLAGNDVVMYGVADRIYLDLYQGLKNDPKFKSVPEKILMSFVQKAISAIPDTPGIPLAQRVSQAVDSIDVTPQDIVSYSSMFSVKTFMFASETTLPLGPEECEYLRNRPKTVQLIRRSLEHSLYEHFHGFFERIYISDFSDFSFPDSYLRENHLRVSVRATSHVDASEYRHVISRFVSEEAAPGGMFIDNGVHRSYSSVPRIAELAAVADSSRDFARIRLVYDQETNYFCSAVIESPPFHDDSFFRGALAPEKVLVSVEEAYLCTFFRWERFIRDLLVSNFKNYDVFWNFQKDIVSLLRESLPLIEDRRFEEVKDRVVALVNSIAKGFEGAGYRYSPIDRGELWSYVSREGKSIDEVLNEPFFLPEWFNRNFHRRY